MFLCVKIFATLLVSGFFTQTFSKPYFDYYWRDYDGSMPVDAVIAGKDKKGQRIYVGQAYVKDKGIFPVHMTDGVQEVYACVGGVHTIRDHIKVLCGPQQNFQWIEGNRTHVHLTLIGHHAVIGGHEDFLGKNGIGRIQFDNGLHIGKVNIFAVGEADLHFNGGGEEKHVQTYELLVYKKVSLDQRIGGA